jgi:hypothetical protein
MDELVQKAFSKEKLVEYAKSYMRMDFGLPPHDDMDKRNAWLERLGLLIVFIDYAWDVWIDENEVASDSANAERK